MKLLPCMAARSIVLPPKGRLWRREAGDIMGALSAVQRARRPRDVTPLCETIAFQ